MLTPLPPATADLILHLGAGTGAALDGHLATPATRILLVEPHPERAAGLERRAGEDPRITVLPAAVGVADGEAELLVFNFPDLSSLVAPTALTSLMPGLRVVARPMVRVLSVASLLDRLGPEGRLHLVLEAPGAEALVLAGLQAAGALPRIATLDLRAGAESLFQDAAPMADLRAMLEAAGFIAQAADLSDPDWPLLRFQLPASVAAAARLTADLAARTAQVQALEAAAAARAVEAAAALQDAGAKLAASAAQVKALEADAAAKASETAAALQDANAKLAARDATVKALEAAATFKAAETAAALQDAQAKLAASTAQVKTLEAAAAAKAAETATALQDAGAKLAASAAQVKTLEAAGATKAAETAAALQDANAKLAASAAQVQALEAAAAARAAETAAALQDAQAKLAAREAQVKTLEAAAAAKAAETAAALQDAGAKLAASAAQVKELEAAVVTGKADLAASVARAEAGLDRMAELQQDNRALAEKQHLLQDEILRLDGQIRLISDVLLREPAA